MEKSLVDALAACASEHHLSVNALVAQCCEYALGHMRLAPEEAE